MVIVRSWSGNLPLIMAIEFHFYEVKSSMEIDGDSYMYLVQLNCIIKNTYDEPAKWLSGKSYLWPSLLVWVQFWELCEVRRRVPLHKVSSFPHAHGVACGLYPYVMDMHTMIKTIKNQSRC